MVALIALDAPDDAVNKGTYHNRSRTALTNRWRDDVVKDVNAFNHCLLVVQNSFPTGSSIQERVNMAVAIKMGKTSVRDYRYKMFEANDWINYSCWKVLRKHRKFLPPKSRTHPEPPPEAEDIGDVFPQADGDDDDDSLGGATTATGTCNTVTTGRTAVNTGGTPKTGTTLFGTTLFADNGQRKCNKRYGEEGWRCRKKRLSSQERLGSPP